MPLPLFDAHLDLAWNALSFNRDLTLPLSVLRAREADLADVPGRGGGTVSLPELQRGQVAVCVATLLARSSPAPPRTRGQHRTALDYADASIAYAVAQGQLSYYRLLEDQGHIQLLRTAHALETHWHNWQPGRPIGVILSMEGTDPIVHPAQVDQWWADGLRAAGLAHYGQGRHAFGTGVCGPLSVAGRALLQEMDRVGMILDVTHLCDESFYEALDLFAGPVLASHHNCRALVPGDRQLSDAQLRLLLERGAVIGMALDAWMLFPGWQRGVTTPAVVGLDAVVDHIDHICTLAGSARHVAIGSDLDGGFGREQTPHDLDTIADLQRLADLLTQRGYTADDVAAIFHGNWLRFFTDALPSSPPTDHTPSPYANP